MKLLSIFSALAMSQLAVAEGPYNAMYNKYCGKGEKGGTLVAGGSTFTYHCDIGQTTGGGAKTNTGDVVRCAEYCDEDDLCNIAVWDEDEGKCWTGQAQGTMNSISGRITMQKDDKASACQAEFDKYRPDAAACPAVNGKVTEVADKRYHVICGQVPTNKLMPKAESGKFYSMEQCFARCSQDSSCTAVAYRANINSCWLTRSRPFSVAWNNARDYETGIKLQY